MIESLRTNIDKVEPAVHTDFGQLLEDNIGDLTGGMLRDTRADLMKRV